MSRNDTQKSLQPLPPALNDLIREATGKYFSRKRRNVYPSGFMFKDIAKCFKVGVTAANKRMAQLKGRNVRLRCKA